MNKILYVIPLLTALLLLSCNADRIYEKNTRIPDGVWNRHSPVVFEVQIEDTITALDLYINIRHTSLYPIRNLYLFVSTTAPSGHSVTDTVEIILADEKGKWFGSGLGDIWDHSQLYKSSIRFAQKGIYSFTYEQAMRLENLPFILDVGLRIEKSVLH